VSELVLFIGLQASGKSSFFRACFADSHEWISKDRLRNNSNPSRRQRQLIEEALRAGRSVVIDNTNPTQRERAELIELARSFGARIVGYYFQSRLADCLERNGLRAGKERVPDVALYATRKKLERPSLTEGFDRLYFVHLLGESAFEVRDWRVEGSEDKSQ
jgi:predicted kinase